MRERCGDVAARWALWECVNMLWRISTGRDSKRERGLGGGGGGGVVFGVVRRGAEESESGRGCCLRGRLELRGPFMGGQGRR